MGGIPGEPLSLSSCPLVFASVSASSVCGAVRWAQDGPWDRGGPSPRGPCRGARAFSWCPCFPRAPVVLRRITAAGRAVLLPPPLLGDPRLQGTVILGVHGASQCATGQHCVPTPPPLCLPPQPLWTVHRPVLPDPKKGPWTPCGPRRGGPVLHRGRFRGVPQSLEPISLPVRIPQRYAKPPLAFGQRPKPCLLPCLPLG